MFYLIFAVLAAEFLLFSFAWHCQKKRFERLLSSCADLAVKVAALEHGVVPDFEEAKKAAEAVNDFNKGLSAIMNFDPMAEAKRARNEENAKGGV